MEQSGEGLLMEAVPVVEVVEIDGIADLAFVRDSGGAEDLGAGFVGVDVAGDGGVEFFHGSGIERSTGLREDPGFELRIGGLFVSDEFFKRGFVETESGKNHLVVALTAGRIVGMKFAGSAKRGLEPETWQVKNSEWSGGAGTDQGNEVGHDDGWFQFGWGGECTAR